MSAHQKISDLERRVAALEVAAAQRRARTQAATARQVSLRAARVAQGLEIARQHWDGPKTVAEIVTLTGLSTRTLYDHLSPRRVVRLRKRKGAEHA